jgi:hypothetical protein
MQQPVDGFDSGTEGFRISDFGFRISDLPPPSLNPPPGSLSRRGAVAEGLVARTAKRREMVRACALQIAAYRGPQQRSAAAATGAAKPPRRPRGIQERTMPRGIGAQRRFRDRAEIGPLGAFLRLERRRDRPSGHPDRAEGGKRGQRSGIGAITRKGGRRSAGSSPPARPRRARAVTGGTEERLRSEGGPVSDRGRGRRPWPAGGHGQGHGRGRGHGLTGWGASRNLAGGWEEAGCAST